MWSCGVAANTSEAEHLPIWRSTDTAPTESSDALPANPLIHNCMHIFVKYALCTAHAVMQFVEISNWAEQQAR